MTIAAGVCAYETSLEVSEETQLPAVCKVPVGLTLAQHVAYELLKQPPECSAHALILVLCRLHLPPEALSWCQQAGPIAVVILQLSR
jgi:hypothetical protein